MPEKKQLTYLFSGWILLCLLQAALTELHPDEAYYWVYAQHLDWGHFHQPPMIAVFIKAGYSLIPTELGVRLFTVLANAAVIYLLYDLIKPRKVVLFAIMLGALFLLHAGSMLAVPDSPLILFGTLFLWLLQRYLENDSWKTALLLGLVVACMLYSKYHTIIFLLACLAPNLSLLKRTSFYTVPVLAGLLFVPHILWQVEHDWPSLRFHLFNREMTDYDPMWIAEYGGAQLILLGPVGLFFLIHTVRNKDQDAFSKTLKFACLGVFAFFLLLTLRSRVEGNWTALGYIPMIILGGQYLNNHGAPKWLKPAALGTVLLILLVRVELVAGFASDKLNPQLNFKYKYYKTWAQTISHEAQGRPVIFINSYQHPALYSFYGATTGIGYSLCNYPGNQYDLYPWKNDYIGRPALLIHNNCGDQHTLIQDGEPCFRHMDDFRSFSGVRMHFSPPGSAKVNDSIQLTIRLENVLPELDIKDGPSNNFPPEFVFMWMQNKEMKSIFESGIEFNKDMLGKTLQVSLPTPDKKGDYLLAAGIRSVQWFPERNSYFYAIEIE